MHNFLQIIFKITKKRQGLIFTDTKVTEQDI